MRRCAALLLSGLLALALASCSDDTKPIKKDTQVTSDAAVDGTSVADVGPASEKPAQQPDSSKVDLPKKTDGPRPGDGPKGDLAKVDGPVVKTDGPVVQTDGPKAEGPVTTTDGPKGEAPVTTADGPKPPPPNGKCSTPTIVTVPASVTGDTAGSVDEFAGVDCGNSMGPWPGAQLYYKVTLGAGKAYKAVLTSSFDAALYAFPAGTACNEAAINTACTDPTPADPKNVYSSDGSGSSTVETVRIAPAAAGDWIIVVDGFSKTKTGTFTLKISEVVTPQNQTCAHPKTLTLAGTPAKVVETGDTSDAVDEYATVDCGNTYGPWDQGQLYYKVSLAAGKKYKATVDGGGFDLAIYAYPAATACNAGAINTACTSPTGDAYNVLNADDTYSGPETIRIAPAAAGDWIIVVDGTEAGSFTLTVAEYTSPTNGVCTAPEALTLTTSPVSISGDSGDPPTANQFAKDIGCGSSYDYDGKQLYYKVTLQAGKPYTFEVTPAGWDAAIYAFTDATCTAATIDTQCATNYMDDNGDGQAETLVITPPATPATTDYIIAIDSYSADAGGLFTLKVTW